MLLSVCIATHHGRRAELEAALRSVLDQGRDDVELCVSDNASADGTQALVEGLARRYAGRIAYRRSEVDRGAARNVLEAVAMARGTWCWLLGSDDALAPGALDAVLTRLTADDGPELTGLTVARANMDRTLAVEEAPEADAFLPDAPERARLFTEPREALAQLGVLLTYLSVHVVRRDAWRAAVERDAGAIGRAGLYPHTRVLARVLLDASGPWAWLPRKLVRNRGANQAIDSVAVDLLGFTLRCASDFCGLWSRLLGPRDPVTAALRERAWRIWAHPVWLDRARETAPSARARFLIEGTRVFWRVGAWWRESVPHLLRGARREPAMDALTAEQMRARVTAELPAAVEAGARVGGSCVVANDGPRELRSAGTCAVHLAVRWEGDGLDDREPARSVLPHAIAPGATARCRFVTNAPWAPGSYRLRLELVQEQVGWFADVDPRSAASRAVRVDATAAAPSDAGTAAPRSGS